MTCAMSSDTPASERILCRGSFSRCVVCFKQQSKREGNVVWTGLDEVAELVPCTAAWWA